MLRHLGCSRGAQTAYDLASALAYLHAQKIVHLVRLAVFENILAFPFSL